MLGSPAASLTIRAQMFVWKAGQHVEQVPNVRDAEVGAGQALAMTAAATQRIYDGHDLGVRGLTVPAKCSSHLNCIR